MLYATLWRKTILSMMPPLRQKSYHRWYDRVERQQQVVVRRSWAIPRPRRQLLAPADDVFPVYPVLLLALGERAAVVALVDVLAELREVLAVFLEQALLLGHLPQETHDGSDVGLDGARLAGRVQVYQRAVHVAHVHAPLAQPVCLIRLQQLTSWTGNFCVFFSRNFLGPQDLY